MLLQRFLVNLEKPEVPEQPAHQWSLVSRPKLHYLACNAKKRQIQHICIRTLGGLLQANVPDSLLSKEIELLIIFWNVWWGCPIMLDNNSLIHTSVCWPFHANCWNHFLNHIFMVSFFVVIDHFRHRVTSISIHTSSLINRLFYKQPHSNFSIKGAVVSCGVITRASNGTQKHYLDEVILVLSVSFRHFFIWSKAYQQLLFRNKEPLLIDMNAIVEMMNKVIVRFH